LDFHGLTAGSEKWNSASPAGAGRGRRRLLSKAVPARNRALHLILSQLYAVWYDFVRINSAVKMSPSKAAGVSKTLRTVNDIVVLIDAAAPAPKPRGP